MTPETQTSDSPQSKGFHPIELLEQASKEQFSGYLVVSHNSVKWRIYFSVGQIFYASHSLDPFGRLERHLRRLSLKIPALTGAIRTQARLKFDGESWDDAYLTPGYQAICWLVEENYLTSEQAAALIKNLTREVFESYLLLKQGSYQFSPSSDKSPKLCRLEVSPFVTECRQQLQAWLSLGSSICSPEQRPYFFTQNQAQQKLSTEQQVKLSKLLRGFSFRQLAVLLNQDELNIAQCFAGLIKSGTILLREPQTPFDRLPVISKDALKLIGASTQDTIPGSPKSDSVSAIPATPLPQKNHQIVCIDDSPAMLNAIEKFLAGQDLSVFTLNDSVKALREIIRIKPDLILMDVGMPTIDGYKLCRMIRNHSLLQATPIVMVTGNTGLIDRAKARVAGATDYMTKPFTQDDLVQMVFKYLT